MALIERKQECGGPKFRFTYDWSGIYPTVYDLDLSGSGCVPTINWKRVAEVHTLDRGDYKRYKKGFQLEATLKWGNDALLRTEYWDTDTYVGRTIKLVNLMFNSSCDNDIFYWPYPGEHPSTYYSVIWDGDYNFNYVEGLTGVGFRGQIKLIGKQILDEIPMYTFEQYPNRCNPIWSA